jgi:hypothetical protein
MREVKNGGVPPASTVSFIMLIHSNTGSGGAAADGLGVVAMPMSSRTQTEVIRNFFMGSLLLRYVNSWTGGPKSQWTAAELLPDFCRTDKPIREKNLEE